jgi:hypothetical protein
LRAALVRAFYGALKDYLEVQQVRLSTKSIDEHLGATSQSRRHIDRAWEAFAALRSFPVSSMVSVDEYLYLDALRQAAVYPLEALRRSEGNQLLQPELESVNSLAARALVTAGLWKALADRLEVGP